MIISRTPFRLSFFGGGSDYPVWYEKNGGTVLSSTINKYCYISCRHLPPFFEHRSRVVWSKIESVREIEEIQHSSVRECLKFMDINEGVEIHHDADLPARSGLGSSSSFTVGLLHVLYALKGKMVTKRQLALDAIHVEQERLEENVGSQDQTAAAFGGLNKIEFGSLYKIKVQPIILENSFLENFQDHILLFFTGFVRNASEIASEQVQNTDRLYSQLNRMSQMVEEALDLLKEQDLKRFGHLLHESWMLKRSLTPKISNDSIDSIYQVACETGAWGGKLLGAGGGGFIMFFAPPEVHSRLKEKLRKILYVPARFENIGSQIIYYGPETESFYRRTNEIK